MVLAFKPQFVPRILEGSKIHTIRKDEKKRWKHGTDIHFATGVRTKNYNQFYKSRCKHIDEIEIVWNNPFRTDFNSSSCIRIGDNGDYFTVYINGKIQSYANVLSLAKNDGFDSVEDFARWFNANYRGRIIHWF